MLRVTLIGIVFFFSLLAPVLRAEANAESFAAQHVVQHYLDAVRLQQNRLRGVSMETEFDAALPKLKKFGRLSALRLVSHLGKISYVVRSFAGDDTIKKDVIARYLSAETQAQPGNQQIAITPANYKFKYKGLVERGERRVHVLQLTPRKKRVGLFKGELWLDPETYMPLRETGQFVKNPSIFLKKVRFVRDYEIQNGIAIPLGIASTVETRLVGKAEIRISYRNIQLQESDEAVAETASR